MLALKAAAPAFTVAEAERIARDVYGLAVDAQPLAGERDSNFRVRLRDGVAFVLKLTDATAEPMTSECAVRALRHCIEQDATVPVPRPFATLTGQDLGRVERDGHVYNSCLLEFLPGRPLALYRAEPSLLHELGNTLARLDEALQGFVHPALLQPLAWDVRRLPELAEYFPLIDSTVLRARVETAAEAVNRQAPALRGLRSQAIHGDCHGSNVLVDADAGRICGLIDFGDMLHAPMILELAVSMAEMLMEGAVALDALPMILRGYAARRPLSFPEVDALYDLVVARQATTSVLHAWRRRHDLPGAGMLESNAGRVPAVLDEMARIGRDVLTHEWQAAVQPPLPASIRPVSLARRHRLLGAGAELFYEPALHLVRGRDVWLYDSNARAYLDVYNNVPHVGHAHPRVVEAIQRQTALLSTHTRYLHAAVLDYAEALTATMPAHLDTCLFVNSGSEANDVAWRMAQFATGRRGALIMANAYHGITMAVAALTPGAGSVLDPNVAAVAPPPAQWHAQSVMAVSEVDAAANDVLRAIAALNARDAAPAALFIDTALTSSGIFDPPAAWGAAIATPVKAAGALLVADEVQYGLGRSGSHLWGFTRRGLQPDIVTVGKPVANGYPMGVVVANRALVEAFQAQFGFFSTFGGNPVAAYAAHAVLEVVEQEGLAANARATGDYMRAELSALARRHPHYFGGVRGTGLLFGLEVLGTDLQAAKQRTRQIVNELASRHRVLTGADGPHASILKLRPPMTFTVEHVDILVAALAATAEQI